MKNKKQSTFLSSFTKLVLQRAVDAGDLKAVAAIMEPFTDGNIAPADVISLFLASPIVEMRVWAARSLAGLQYVDIDETTAAEKFRADPDILVSASACRNPDYDARSTENFLQLTHLQRCAFLESGFAGVFIQDIFDFESKQIQITRSERVELINVYLELNASADEEFSSHPGSNFIDRAYHYGDYDNLWKLMCVWPNGDDIRELKRAALLNLNRGHFGAFVAFLSIPENADLQWLSINRNQITCPDELFEILLNSVGNGRRSLISHAQLTDEQFSRILSSLSAEDAESAAQNTFLSVHQLKNLEARSAEVRHATGNINWLNIEISRREKLEAAERVIDSDLVFLLSKPNEHSNLKIHQLGKLVLSLCERMSKMQVEVEKLNTDERPKKFKLF